ncbi:MAG: hypothetical protein AAGF47_07815 [Planctomycetota bacterium]
MTATLSHDPGTQFDMLQIEDVYRFACYLAENEEEAESLVLEAMRGYAGVSMLSGLDAAAAIWRAKSPVVETLQTNKPTGGVLTATAAASLGPGELDDAILEALQELPGPARVIVVLWGSDGCSQTAIASGLGCPIGYVLDTIDSFEQQVLMVLRDRYRSMARRRRDDRANGEAWIQETAEAPASDTRALAPAPTATRGTGLKRAPVRRGCDTRTSRPR